MGQGDGTVIDYWWVGVGGRMGQYKMIRKGSLRRWQLNRYLGDM